MSNSREGRQDEVHDTSEAADVVMILGIVVAGIGCLGGLRIQAATPVLARATLQLAISTAYYGAAGVAVAGTGYAAAQGTVFAAQQTRQGYLATARAAHRASEQIRGRAMAVNRAAMQAAMQAQSTVISSAETVGNRAAEVSNAAGEVANRAANAMHGAVVNASSLVNRAQEAIPIRIVTAEEAFTRADGDDGQEYYLELEVDGATVWVRISGREDLPEVVAGAFGDAVLGNNSVPQQMAEDRPAGESLKSSDDAGGEVGDASHEERLKIGGGGILDHCHATLSSGLESSKSTGTSSATQETDPQDKSEPQQTDEDPITDNSVARSNDAAENDGRELGNDGFEILVPDAWDQDIDPATPSSEGESPKTERSSSNADAEGDSRDHQAVDDLAPDQFLGQPGDTVENRGEASDEDGFEIAAGGSLGHHHLTPSGEGAEFSSATRTSSNTAETDSEAQQMDDGGRTAENLGLTEDVLENDGNTSDEFREGSLDHPTPCREEDEPSRTSRTSSHTTEADPDDDSSWDFVVGRHDGEDMRAGWVVVAITGKPASSTSGADSYLRQ